MQGHTISDLCCQPSPRYPVVSRMIQSGFQEKYQAEITGITLTYKLIEYGTCFRYMTDYHKHYMLAQRDFPLLPSLPDLVARRCYPRYPRSPSLNSTPMSLNPLPWPYYFTFAIYEPLLVIVSCIWAFAYPREVNGLPQDCVRGN